MKFFRLCFAVFLITIGIFLTTNSASASEGTIELQNTTGGRERCFAMSLLIQNINYQILVSCRDLVYPLESTQSAYVVWSTPIQTTGVPLGTNVQRLGELGFGKVLLRTSYSFSNLFVTTETTAFTRTPTGSIIMQGDVRPISFLERTSIPTSTPQITKKPQSFGELLKLTPTPTPRGGGIVSGIVTALIILGVIILFFIIVGIIIFVTYRSRRATF